jgi:hypothetical protein
VNASAPDGSGILPARLRRRGPGCLFSAWGNAIAGPEPAKVEAQLQAGWVTSGEQR